MNNWSKKEEAPAFPEGPDTWQVGSRIENVECGIGAKPTEAMATLDQP
jgi:hypothetical protein